MRVVSIKKYKDLLDNEGVQATVAVPLHSSKFDPTDKRKSFINIKAIKRSIEETEITICFNRFEVGTLDVYLALLSNQFGRRLSDERIAGSCFPLYMDDYERELIYDHKHDEVREP